MRPRTVFCFFAASISITACGADPSVIVLNQPSKGDIELQAFTRKLTSNQPFMGYKYVYNDYAAEPTEAPVPLSVRSEPSIVPAPQYMLVEAPLLIETPIIDYTLDDLSLGDSLQSLSLVLPEVFIELPEATEEDIPVEGPAIVAVDLVN